MIMLSKFLCDIEICYIVRSAKFSDFDYYLSEIDYAKEACTGIFVTNNMVRSTPQYF